MNAIKLLRQMHADAKTSFRLILGSRDPGEAAALWQQLQTVLKLHEEMEETHLYGPLHKAMAPGTPLGDWERFHHADVAVVEQLIAGTPQLEPGTPAWRMQIGQINDMLARHIMDEEGQIFPRIEQTMDAGQLEQAGASMLAMQKKAQSGGKSASDSAKTAADTAKSVIGKAKSALAG